MKGKTHSTEEIIRCAQELDHEPYTPLPLLIEKPFLFSLRPNNENQHLTIALVAYRSNLEDVRIL